MSSFPVKTRENLAVTVRGSFVINFLAEALRNVPIIQRDALKRHRKVQECIYTKTWLQPYVSFKFFFNISCFSNEKVKVRRPRNPPPLALTFQQVSLK